MSDFFQDRVPHNHCWGCGPHNPSGLHIKSRWLTPETSICEYHPSPDHCAGPIHIVYGGLIASVIDCHSVCTAIAAMYRAEGRELGEAPEIWCATGELNIRYLKPLPLAPFTAEASLIDIVERKIRLRCRIIAGIGENQGDECARAEVLAVRVPESWTRQP